MTHETPKLFGQQNTRDRGQTSVTEARSSFKLQHVADGTLEKITLPVASLIFTCRMGTIKSILHTCCEDWQEQTAMIVIV